MDKSLPADTSGLLRRLTSYASVGVAALLIGAKLMAFLKTDSVAILSSLVDSGVDMLASLMTAYGISIALKPADHDHRFGHGKAEALAALGQSAFICLSAFLLLGEALPRFIEPRVIEQAGWGYGVMGLSVVLTLALLALQTYTIRRTKSLAIASDRMHYVGDVLVNLGVVLAFILQNEAGWLWADPLFAVLTAAGMLVGSARIGSRSVRVLMDSELPEDDRQMLRDLALGVSGVLGVHDLRTRSDSERPIIEMHVEMDPHLSLRRAHDIAEGVMQTIEARFPGADVLIHQDPAGVDERRRDEEIENNNKLDGRSV